MVFPGLGEFTIMIITVKRTAAPTAMTAPKACDVTITTGRLAFIFATGNFR
jgi:hypothetical protein